MRLSKKADAFFDKGNFAALCASVVRLGRTIRRSLRAKRFPAPQREKMCRRHIFSGGCAEKADAAGKPI